MVQISGKGRKSVLAAGRNSAALRRRCQRTRTRTGEGGVCDAAGAPPAAGEGVEQRGGVKDASVPLGTVREERGADDSACSHERDEKAPWRRAGVAIASSSDAPTVSGSFSGVPAALGATIGEDEIAALVRMIGVASCDDEALEGVLEEEEKKEWGLHGGLGSHEAARARFFDSEEQDIERDIEELSRMVSRARIVSKAAAEIGNLSFLDGTDISSLDEKAFEKIVSTGRLRRKKPLPQMKPTLPPMPSRDGLSRIISSSWMRSRQMAGAAPAGGREATTAGGVGAFGSAFGMVASPVPAVATAATSATAVRRSRDVAAASEVGTGARLSTSDDELTDTSARASSSFGFSTSVKKRVGVTSGGGGDDGSSGTTTTFDQIESVVMDIKEWKALNKVFNGMADELGREPSRAEWAFRAGLSLGELERRLRWYRKCDQLFVELMNPIVAHVYKKYGFRGTKYMRENRTGDHVDQADMFMAGMMGAWECVDKWVPATEKNSKNRFSFLVTYYIRSAMSKCLTDRLRDDTPTSVFILIGKVRRTSKMLAERLGRQPTDEELGTVLNISAKRVAKVKAAATRRVSADRPSETSVADGDMRSAADTIGDPTTAHLLEDCVDEMMDDDIEALLKTLAPREYMVLSRRYPRADEDAGTLEEIGASLNVCRERVRQIEDKALQKLKHQSRSGKALFHAKTYSGI